MATAGVQDDEMRCVAILLMTALLAGCAGGTSSELADPGPSASVQDPEPRVEEALTISPPGTPEETPDPEQIYQAGGNVVGPRRISGDFGDIDAVLRSRRAKGFTMIQAVINTEGRVDEVEFLTLDHRDDAEPIEDILKTWRFEPATLHGKPVRAYYNLSVQIRLQ